MAFSPFRQEIHWWHIIRVYNSNNFIVVLFDRRPLRPIHTIYVFIQVYRRGRSAILGGEKRLNGVERGRGRGDNVNGLWYLTGKPIGGGKMSPLRTGSLTLFRTGQSERSTRTSHCVRAVRSAIRVDRVITYIVLCTRTEARSVFDMYFVFWFS